jgi:hypothetical protein
MKAVDRMKTNANKRTSLFFIKPSFYFKYTRMGKVRQETEKFLAFRMGIDVNSADVVLCRVGMRDSPTDRHLHREKFARLDSGRHSSEI